MNNTALSKKRSGDIGKNDCISKNGKTTFACNLTTAGFRKRKETIIAGLQKQVLLKKELKNGYAYKFTGSDKMVDDLAEFIKTERACCDFFVFNLSLSGDKSVVWLEITGPQGVKDFIKSELEM